MKKFMIILTVVVIFSFSLIGISYPYKASLAVKESVEPTAINSPQLTPAPTPSPSESPVPSPEPTLSPGEEIANYARLFDGYPYKYGEETPEKGFDCSGLVFYVYKQFGYPLYRTASDMHKNGIEVDESEMQPGDIILFKKGYWIYHCGIYLGGWQFIHAKDEGAGVCISWVEEYSNNNIEVRRIVGTVEPFTQEPFIAEE